MAPLSPRFSVFDPAQVPVIVLGQVRERSGPVAAPEKSQWDGRPVQLFKVRIQIEQVVKGEVPSKELDVYYFADMGAINTSVAPVRGGLYDGHSELLFLQQDNNRLRTICEGWRSCIIWVRTGTHYNFKPEPGTPIEEVVTNVLLSRGDHTTDEQMIDAIYHPELRWGTLPVYNALKQLAANEKSPAVRVVALERLRNFRIHYGPLRRATPIVSKQQ